MKRLPPRMYRLIIFAVLLAASVATLIFYTFRKKSSLIYVDFDISMQAEKYAPIINRGHGPLIYKIFKKIYEKNNFLQVKPAAQVKIPKVVHFVWIQGNPPEKYNYIIESWKWYNPEPEWTYKLWTDKEIKLLKYLPRDFYDAAINYGEKSDIAKYTIVYEEGGIYADITDEECLRPFDELHYLYDFYIGVQPLDTNTVQIGLGLFAARAGHPLLKQVIESLHRAHHIPQIVAKTGPLYFTQIFCATIFDMPGVNVVLPASYFYPRGYNQGPDKREWQQKESLAVHHWAGSWLGPEAFCRS